MIGDRVRINFGTMVDTASLDNIPVYSPRVGANGDFIVANDGSVTIDTAGGVKPDTVGVIHGHPVKVYRTTLVGQSKIAGLGANDHVFLYPVMLEQYQQVGWFPTDHIRILEGGKA